MVQGLQWTVLLGVQVSIILASNGFQTYTLSLVRLQWYKKEWLNLIGISDAKISCGTLYNSIMFQPKFHDTWMLEFSPNEKAVQEFVWNISPCWQFDGESNHTSPT